MQRLPRLRLQLNLAPLPKREASKPVPLGLVEPTFARRNLIDRLRLRRRIRRPDGQPNRLKLLPQLFRRKRSSLNPVSFFLRRRFCFRYSIHRSRHNSPVNRINPRLHDFPSPRNTLNPVFAVPAWVSAVGQPPPGCPFERSSQVL